MLKSIFHVKQKASLVAREPVASRMKKNYLWVVVLGELWEWELLWVDLKRRKKRDELCQHKVKKEMNF